MKLRSASRKKVEVKHLAAPPTFVKPKKIHPRHLLPLIREGWSAVSTVRVMKPSCVRSRWPCRRQLWRPGRRQ